MDTFKQIGLRRASQSSKAAARRFLALVVMVALLAAVPNWLGPVFGVETGPPAGRRVDDSTATKLAGRTPTSIQITSIIANLIIRLAGPTGGNV